MNTIFRCIELWKQEFSYGMKFSNTINKLIELQENDGYIYFDTVDIGDYVLIYFKKDNTLFSSQTSTSTKE